MTCNELSMLIKIILHYKICNCDKLHAGEYFEYLWADETNYKKATDVMLFFFFKKNPKHKNNDLCLNERYLRQNTWNCCWNLLKIKSMIHVYFQNKVIPHIFQIILNHKLKS